MGTAASTVEVDRADRTIRWNEEVADLARRTARRLELVAESVRADLRAAEMRIKARDS